MKKGKTKGVKIKGKMKQKNKKRVKPLIKANLKDRIKTREISTDFSRDNILKLPKIELHCHLDGGLRPATVLELLKNENLKENENLDTISKKLTAPENCSSLDDYLKAFDLPITVMQTKENLERVSFELFEDAANENVKYLEVRFAPQLHKEKGLTTKEIIESVVKGMKKAEKKYDIKGNYILSCMRHLSAESALEIIRNGEEFLGNGVAATDLCGGEELGFATKFIETMKIAKELGYHITIHAGETGFGKNVTDAINLLGAERIGHGIYINNDDEAYNLVKEKNIHLEVCPTSNIQTRAFDNYKNHTFYKFCQDGLNISFNTDNRTVSSTTMTREIFEISNVTTLNIDEYKTIYLNSVEAAFVSDEIKESLKKKI